MTETNRDVGISTARLRLSVQRALLGVIGIQVLGVCIVVDQNNIEMNVFVEGLLPEDQQEAFDIATTEIIADFSPEISVDVRFIQNTKSPLRCSGIWVFVRYACQGI
jgi:hypothetical protein